MTAVSPAQPGLRAQPPKHIIDVLIAERAPTLAASPAWRLLRPLLYRLLDYHKARGMAEAIALLPGADALAYVARTLALSVDVRFAARIPARGRLIVVCNHPTGIADGIAVHDALMPVRPDLVFYANADALRVAPRLGEVLIPVEWMEARRTRQGARHTLQRTRAAMEAERALVVFPSGRLARRRPDGRLLDLPWAPTAVSVARRHAAPVLPIHVAGPWSTLFHLFHRVSSELRDITLFHELLNKRGRAFRLTVGPLIPPAVLAGEAAEIAPRLKTYVEEVLPAAPGRPFA